MRKGGDDRTTFKLTMEVQQLQATLNYESSSAAALALASIEDVHFDLAIHPSTLGVSATLGNLRAQDATLNEVCLCHTSRPWQPQAFLASSWHALHVSGHCRQAHAWRADHTACTKLCHAACLCTVHLFCRCCTSSLVCREHAHVTLLRCAGSPVPQRLQRAPGCSHLADRAAL